MGKEFHFQYQQKYKDLRINLTTNVQDLYKENDMFCKESKDT